MDTARVLDVLRSKGFMEPAFDKEFKAKWKQNDGRILNLRFELEMAQGQDTENIIYKWRVFADDGELVARTYPSGNPIHGLDQHKYNHLNEWLVRPSRISRPPNPQK